MFLKDILDFKNGKSLPVQNMCTKGYPVYGSTGIIAMSSHPLTNSPTLIIGRVGANCGQIQKTTSACWITDNCILAQVKNKFLFDYVYYLLQTMALNQYHIGSAQPLLTSDILKNLKVLHDYDINEQQHIVNTM